MCCAGSDSLALSGFPRASKITFPSIRNIRTPCHQETRQLLLLTRTHNGPIIPTTVFYIEQIPTYDLHALDHVAGVERYVLHDLARDVSSQRNQATTAIVSF